MLHLPRPIFVAAVALVSSSIHASAALGGASSGTLLSFIPFYLSFFHRLFMKALL